MPGVWARPSGWRRRGCRRPPRTGVLPEVVGLPPGDLIKQVRFGPAMEVCCGQHCVLELLVFPGRGGRTRAGTARVVLPSAAGQSGWPRTSRVRLQRGGGTPRRGRCCLRVQGRKLAHQLEDELRGRSRDKMRLRGPVWGLQVLVCARVLSGQLPYQRQRNRSVILVRRRSTVRFRMGGLQVKGMIRSG